MSAGCVTSNNNKILLRAACILNDDLNTIKQKYLPILGHPWEGQKYQIPV